MTQIDADGRENQIIIIFFIALYAIIVLRNAWICDDAYITLRSAYNFVHGFGLRWNVDERVQAFTNPLWLFVTAPLCIPGWNVYFPLLALCLILSLAAVTVFAVRLTSGVWAAISGISILMLSDAFVDFSTSGLENPLTFLLLALLLVLYFKRETTPSRLFRICIISALLLLNRPDEIFLIGPMIAYAFQQTKGRRKLRALALGFSPFVAWEIFSLVYYGFPVPNTAYAKLPVGVDGWLMIRQGVCYLINSLAVDPLTVMGILLAIVLPFVLRDRRGIAISFGLILTTLYVVRVGGDFMSGRFLAAPLFVSVCLFFRYFPRASSRLALVVIAGAALLGLASPRSPVYSNEAEGVGHAGSFLPNNIVDERLWYNQTNGLINYNREAPYWPRMEWVLFGNQAREQKKKVTTFATIGMYGYYAGPGVHVIDPYGLTDPLIARMPIHDAEYQKPGHLLRKVPVGYKETVETGENHISDPYLAALYDKLRLITQGNLFSMPRLYEIIKFNLGVYDTLIDLYRQPHRIEIRQADFSQAKAVGTYWAEKGNIILDSTGVDITFDSVVTFPRIELSHDHNDVYRLEYYHGDSLIGGDTLRAEIPPEAGLSVTCVKVPPRAVSYGYDRIRILPFGGDRLYSVGHLRIGCDTAAP